MKVAVAVVPVPFTLGPDVEATLALAPPWAQPLALLSSSLAKEEELVQIQMYEFGFLPLGTRESGTVMLRVSGLYEYDIE